MVNNDIFSVSLFVFYEKRCTESGMHPNNLVRSLYLSVPLTVSMLAFPFSYKKKRISHKIAFNSQLFDNSSIGNKCIERVAFLLT
jgi:hypothetical protein